MTQKFAFKVADDAMTDQFSKHLSLYCALYTLMCVRNKNNLNNEHLLGPPREEVAVRNEHRVA